MKSILQNKAYLYLTCLFLGIITSFSLPPYNFVFLNFLSLPTLLYILINYTHKKIISFFVGWVFGFGYFISNLYWITNSLTFDVNFKLIIPFALILIPLFLGIFYGLVTFLSSLFNLKNKLSSVLIFSIFFGGIEFLRSFIFGGFPWNLLVFSISNNLPSLQILSYVGTYSLNLLSITIFLLPIIFFHKYKSSAAVIFLCFGLILVVINYSYGYFNIKNFEKKKYDKLDSVIRVVSPKIPIERFLTNHSPEKNIDEFDKSGLGKYNSNIISTPGVLESPFIMECKLIDIIKLGNKPGSGNLILGEVVFFHINEDLFKDDGSIDAFKIDQVGRSGGGWYTKVKESLFKLSKPKGVGVGFDSIPYKFLNTSLTGNQLAKLAAVEKIPKYINVNIPLNFNDLVKDLSEYINKDEIEKAWQYILKWKYLNE